MKKMYEAPKAEKFDFSYEENVVASQTGGATNFDTWPKTDYSNPDWTCEIRFADQEWVCGYDGHDNSNPQWECKLK